MDKVYLSIIIPAFNEEKRIERTLSSIFAFFSRNIYDYEVILVNDGSSDGTEAIASKSRLFKDGRLKIIDNGKNRGKGYSVRNGINNSIGEYVLLSDADLSTPIEEISKLFKWLRNGYDIVIGSRALGDSFVQVRQPWYRELMGKTFNLLVRLFAVRGIKDTQCGFKLLKGHVARGLAGKMRIDGFCFDVEMLRLAAGEGCSIKETGVVWINSPQSKVRIFSSSFAMFFDLFRIISTKNKDTI